MTQNGTVIALDGNTAVVEVLRMSACSSCNKESSDCIACTLGGARKKTTVKVMNTLSAKVGDSVELEATTFRIIFCAFAVFILPVILALGLYLTASVIFGAYSIYTYLSPLFGVMVSFFFIYFVLGRRAEKDNGISMVRIIGHTDVDINTD